MQYEDKVYLMQKERYELEEDRKNSWVRHSMYMAMIEELSKMNLSLQEKILMSDIQRILATIEMTISILDIKISNLDGRLKELKLF